MNDSLYDRDFYAWANQQATLLREGRLNQADIANIAEEIESMGRSEKRELVSRLSVLFLHLLKWEYQSTLRGNSWRLTIEEQRDQVAEHLEDNPSLKAYLNDIVARAYRHALVQAQRETGLGRDTFPATCPYSFDQAMDPNFWPE